MTFDSQHYVDPARVGSDAWMHDQSMKQIHQPAPAQLITSGEDGLPWGPSIGMAYLAALVAGLVGAVIGGIYSLAQDSGDLSSLGRAGQCVVIALMSGAGAGFCVFWAVILWPLLAITGIVWGCIVVFG